ncbi:retrovirus-related Pol polyprotein from transposon gypsy [Trichonephila clavipes]|nr:retrovirus-related Pol polyprotein from transposon gypsy [Trichonephila clavipes]
MPFGLSAVARNFQKAIGIILKPVIGKFVIVDMDDVIISSPSFTQHIEHLKVQKAFDVVKVGITKAPVLKLPDFKKRFELFTDASSIGVGAVLNHEQRPVVFASRTLSAAESNYTVTERECLAVVWALNKFRTYLGSLPIKVITDHATLTRVTHDFFRYFDFVALFVFDYHRWLANPHFCRVRRPVRRKMVSYPCVPFGLRFAVKGRVSSADKGLLVYPLDHRPDAVALYSGCTPGKRHAWSLSDDRHTASLVGVRGGWRHAKTMLFFMLMDPMQLCLGNGLVLPNLNNDQIYTNVIFLLIPLQSVEISKKSPFTIHKTLIGIGGEPKSVKRLRSGDLLFETLSALQTVREREREVFSPRKNFS